MTFDVYKVSCIYRILRLPIFPDSLNVSLFLHPSFVSLYTYNSSSVDLPLFFPFFLPPSMCLSVESLYAALRNIDRADIVTSLEGQAPQPAPSSSEEGACRLGDRDSTLLSPSVINGKTHKHIKHHTHKMYRITAKIWHFLFNK